MAVNRRWSIGDWFLHSPTARLLESRKPVLLASVFVLICCVAATAQVPVPLGPEFQVNTYTPDVQSAPAIGVDADGDFVVVWSSFGEDGYVDELGFSRGVFARRFNAAGTPLATAFQVNTFFTRNQYDPDVALDSDGDFVVVWISYLQDGSEGGVFGKRFNSSGAALGSEFQINSVTLGYQVRPKVALDADGDFVVVWASTTIDGGGYGVAARRFNSSGVALGVETRVNSFTAGAQTGPAVDRVTDGAFVVTWVSLAQDGSGTGVFGQRFASSGSPAGPEFAINTYVTNYQLSPAVAMDDDGDFAVVWNSYLQDGSSWGVFGRRFDSAGTPGGGEFPVNITTSGVQVDPAIAADADGDFVIAWEGEEQDGSSTGVFARSFNDIGVPQNLETLINTYVTGRQYNAAVSASAAGDFVVAWASPHDGGPNGIFAQRFDVKPLVDVDGDGAYLPLTDGLLLLRFGFGFTGNTLITGAVGMGCTRCDVPSITKYLRSLI
jgi:hypothetical protein